MLKKFFNYVFELIKVVVISLAIIIPVRYYLIQPFYVKGASMEPNFYDGEYILTDKVSYRFREPARGDVVIFKAPKNPELDYIKRIIALPGESIKIQNGDFFINNQKLNEVYLPNKTAFSGGLFLPQEKEIKIPQNSYFVFGDNRSHSSDSREWGPIQKSDIVGRAFLRYWPPQRIGVISSTSCKYFLSP
ncbi:signal peptidase I [Candidatus Falkowbacteria bacterium]|nr:signal peptidase I [Candidatus Falkowbacteria bacterium]